MSEKDVTEAWFYVKNLMAFWTSSISVIDVFPWLHTLHYKINLNLSWSYVTRDMNQG